MSTEDAVVGIVGLAIAAKILQDNDRPRKRTKAKHKGKAYHGF